jgi:cytochrome-b5 reductase
MASTAPPRNKFLTNTYVEGVYIPSGLLVVGCLIVKKEWTPFAVLLALVLGGYKIWNTSMYQ